MLQEKFSSLSEPELLEEIGRTGRVLSFRQGETIVQGEKYARTIPLILQGTVKALRVNESYSEIFLYYLTTGQACATSLMSCLTNKPSNLKAIAEEDTVLVAVSAADARKWFGQFASWRQFALLSLSECMEELIATIDSIAFSNADQRLVALLATKSKALRTDIIPVTHQQLADELASSREVVSRLLKQLEQRGLVKLSRNRITLLSAM